MSLYEELGGEPAIEAALEVFYDRVMNDPVVSDFFGAVSLDGLKAKQKVFLTMAFGGPNTYEGRDLRTAHATARLNGLDDAVFERYMGHFRATLEQLGVGPDHVDQVMGIAYGGKADVLDREVAS